ncbi:uncharacterized protein SPPG_02005 [Spizellomyces punctatus DAOM BR117]|uniref:Arrestin C-terminal-like domain-containing protein n=1 Tax=Spizellomyces punctatus (strain DAOM BR117) TaxID=645134 RepID=A0A0L0HQ39_SPIPD|nr:uncharacterized protein SPPG_02005 [Spizellomyces punctatus DAOM BR117]KND02924.1 hypothetical protein SPPG_02005 [Spizellomyces punctatus DAOM BR117]|eukprot:XP_016610963.1 hypothetical protein SPPG_02005 [Spizellomyces punctatus DAOM BR117]
MPMLNPAANGAEGTERQRRKKTSKSLLDFSLHLDENRTIFTPGQKVEGHLLVSFSIPSEVKLLRIRFTGVVQTQLYKSDNSSLTSQNTSTVTLFKEIQTFCGSAVPGEIPEVIPAGEHRFPFAFRVPPTQLPASFEGPYGRVKYEVAAVLVRPHHMNKLTYLNLTIPSTMDATDLDLMQSATATAEGPVGFWWWRSGHLEVNVSTPKSGYASEEVVPVKVEITNHSGSGTILKEVYLKQRATYKTFNETRGPKTERIHRLAFTEHYPSTTRRVSRVINFPIPSTNIMSPSINTTILDVTHLLIVKVLSKAKFSKPIKVELPIVIAGFPAVYFDNNLTRMSVDTLPPYEQSETVGRRRSSTVSRLSRDFIRGRRSRSTTRERSRSRTRTWSIGRRGSRHSGSSQVGADWEPVDGVAPDLPPVPELPAHLRRTVVGLPTTTDTFVSLPVTRARGSTINAEQAAGTSMPGGDTETCGTTPVNGLSMARQMERHSRRASVVLTTGNHGIEGEFGSIGTRVQEDAVESTQGASIDGKEIAGNQDEATDQPLESALESTAGSATQVSSVNVEQDGATHSDLEPESDVTTVDETKNDDTHTFEQAREGHDENPLVALRNKDSAIILENSL